MRVRAHRRAARTALVGPIGLRQDARIGEDRDAGAVAQRDPHRLARLGDVRAGADHLHARPLRDWPWSRRRRRCPSRARDCRPSRSRRSPPRASAAAPSGRASTAWRACGSADAALGEARFELAEHDVGRAQHVAGGDDSSRHNRRDRARGRRRRGTTWVMPRRLEADRHRQRADLRESASARLAGQCEAGCGGEQFLQRDDQLAAGRAPRRRTCAARDRRRANRCMFGRSMLELVGIGKDVRVAVGRGVDRARSARPRGSSGRGW